MPAFCAPPLRLSEGSIAEAIPSQYPLPGDDVHLMPLPFVQMLIKLFGTTLVTQFTQSAERT